MQNSGRVACKPPGKDVPPPGGKARAASWTSNAPWTSIYYQYYQHDARNQPEYVAYGQAAGLPWLWARAAEDPGVPALPIHRQQGDCRHADRSLWGLQWPRVRGLRGSSARAAARGQGKFSSAEGRSDAHPVTPNRARVLPSTPCIELASCSAAAAAAAAPAEASSALGRSLS